MILLDCIPRKPLGEPAANEATNIAQQVRYFLRPTTVLTVTGGVAGSGKDCLAEEVDHALRQQGNHSQIIRMSDALMHLGRLISWPMPVVIPDVVATKQAARKSLTDLSNHVRSINPYAVINEALLGVNDGAEFIHVTGASSKHDTEVFHLLSQLYPEKLGVLYIAVSASEEHRKGRMKKEAWEALAGNSIEAERAQFLIDMPPGALSVVNDFSEKAELITHCVPGVVAELMKRRNALSDYCGDDN